MSKLIYNDLDKIVLEVTKAELEEKTFDVVWDEIRNVYSAEEYSLMTHEYTHNKMIIEFTLYRKNYKQLELEK